MHITTQLAYDDLFKPIRQLRLSDADSASSFAGCSGRLAPAVVTATMDVLVVKFLIPVVTGNVTMATVQLLYTIAMGMIVMHCLLDINV